MCEMFIKTKQRYMTCGIQSKLDMTFIQFLWELIEEEKKHVKLDYLQVLTLTKELEDDGKTIMQVIKHSQEEPPYEKIYRIPIDSEVIEDKIFLIDEPDYSVMLFAREY